MHDPVAVPTAHVDRPTDPSDVVKSLDAKADGQFQQINRRAGYGDQLARTFRVARAGGTLAAGEGAQIIEHYEALVRNAYAEGYLDAVGKGDAELLDVAWERSDARTTLERR